MTQHFLINRDFHSASFKDLLDARDTYHIHLSHLDNVIATAIGKYRIRTKELDKDDNLITDEALTKSIKSEPKTLENSKITKWSWPCVLVFVNDWKSQDEFCDNPDQIVPKLLYLPDGRVVPTCVLLIEDKEISPPQLNNFCFPSELIGGGYPVITEVQGDTHIGSVGCLVTDGDLIYALTNKHVTGEKDRIVYSYFKGQKCKIGTSSDKIIGKKNFSEIYPDWPGTRTLCNLDVGLIKVDDVSQWTAQVFGIGEIDKPINLKNDTISLELIGCPVKAFGAAAGSLKGEIQALFYRYKSMGGYEYVADLLIGQRNKSKKALNTTHGDSGTLWFWDSASGKKKDIKYRPIAIQWGGHRVISGDSEKQFQFALAACISNVCAQLDVEIVRGINIGFNEYWGKTGHYKIAAKACELMSDDKLSKLMTMNMERVGFSDESIENGDLKKIDNNEFVPLADVPDLVWRNTRKKDSSNHFADMDQEGKGDYNGKTLLELCQNKTNLSSEIWNKFYESLEIESKDRGALPFRVWQIYDEMVSAVKNSEVDKYVCAAGILSHYVADACEPLHVSFLHHGREGYDEKKVHSFYESNILDRKCTDIIAGVNELLQDYKVDNKINGGKESAMLTIDLMRNTFKTLPPMEIIDAFNEKEGRARTDYMWKKLGDKTNIVLSEGCKILAVIWQSAWEEGNGDLISESKLTEIPKDRLKELYMDRDFLEAKRLNEMELS
ncbi:MAG: hypothetical protein PHN88_14990 [Ignavibacteria bacterium]|nr:hypothetical protein [Ignavibacteria bacterium]